MEAVLEWLKEARGEIIGGLVLALLGWLYSRYRVFIERHRQQKQEFERMREEIAQLGATKQEFERLQEALREAEAKKAEEAKQREAMQRQLEAQRQELERVKAMKQRPVISDSDFLALCKSGDAGKVEEAIRNGANINAKDNEGMTALMFAASEGATNIAEVLLKNGANVSVKNNDGKTALMLATSKGDLIMELFIASPWEKIQALKKQKGRGEIAALLRYHGAKE